MSGDNLKVPSISHLFEKLNKFFIVVSPKIKIRSLSSSPLFFRRKVLNSSAMSKGRSIGVGASVLFSPCRLRQDVLIKFSFFVNESWIA